MSSNNLIFPALYNSANEGSINAQKRFLSTVRLEYFLLFFVSVASATRNLFGISLLIITILLVILAGLFVFKIFKKLDQDWYRCRALAESVKTSTWRFSMRAHPFEDTDNIDTQKAKFRNLLHEILQANKHIAAILETDESEQITQSMIDIRKLSLEDRIAYYVTNRIDNQREWYSKKSTSNKKALRRWFAVTIIIYILAAIILNSELLGLPKLAMAFDPMIVLVTSVLGWLQMKRHSELTASYNLTAHEIGITKSNSNSIKTEDELSDFINEAELAFSREHTQWVARRDAN